jgi:hypothetical protein
MLIDEAFGSFGEPKEANKALFVKERDAILIHVEV